MSPDPPNGNGHHPEPEPEPILVAPSALEAAEQDWPREWIPAFLRAYALTGIVKTACQEAGISQQTYYVAIRGEPPRSDGGTPQRPVPGFAEAIAVAREEAVDTVEEIAHRVGTFGMPYTVTTVKTRRLADGTVETTEQTVTGSHRSNNVMLRWLEAMRPDKWSRRQDVRHGGADGGPIQHEVVSHTPRTPERVLELALMAQELGLASPRELDPGPGEVEAVAEEVE